MTLFENNDVCNLKLSASSGTLESTYKTKVAAELYKIIKWDDMTDEAKKLAEKIYMFIKNANQDHFLS